MRREHALRILSAHEHDIRERGVTREEIRDVGNILRHAYPDVEPERIWDIATAHIHPLAAVLAMIDEVEKRGRSIPFRSANVHQFPVAALGRAR